MSMVSFTTTGTPASGPSASPAARRASIARASARAAGLTKMMAFSRGLSAAMRSRKAWVSCSQVKAPAARPSCTPATVSSTRSISRAAKRHLLPANWWPSGASDGHLHVWHLTLPRGSSGRKTHNGVWHRIHLGPASVSLQQSVCQGCRRTDRPRCCRQGDGDAETVCSRCRHCGTLSENGYVGTQRARLYQGSKGIDAVPKTMGRVTMIRDEHAPSRGGHPRLTRRIRLIYRGRQGTDAGNSPDVVALPALPSFNRGR